MFQPQDEEVVIVKPPANDFRTFLYNKKEGKFLGKTPVNWAKLLLFYCIFYFMLCAFTFAMWFVFKHSNIDGKASPRRMLHDSIIGANPALTMQPAGVSDFNYLNIKSKSSQAYFVGEIKKFLKPYYTQHHGQSYCYHNSNNTLDRSKESCNVDVFRWDSCTEEDNYGYNISNPTPCIFLKLNRVFSWTPTFYKSPSDFPDDMPSELKNSITKFPEQRNTVWVSCQGVTKSDEEHLGTVKYFPEQGFPGYYFPFVNGPGYLNPLVAVQFVNLARNVDVKIQCRYWVKNLEYATKESAMIKFKIKIHDK